MLSLIRQVNAALDWHRHQLLPLSDVRSGYDASVAVLKRLHKLHRRMDMSTMLLQPLTKWRIHLCRQAFNYV